MKSFIALAVLVATVSAQFGGGGRGGVGGIGGGGLGGGYGGGWDHYSPPHYKYNYGVADKHTGDYKNAYEVREGHITKGSYSLLQPDGVIRTVNYIVDPKGGFQAQVLNKGWAHHGKGGLGGGIGGGAFLG
jgi:hypothetical protein